MNINGLIFHISCSTMHAEFYITDRESVDSADQSDSSGTPNSGALTVLPRRLYVKYNYIQL